MHKSTKHVRLKLNNTPGVAYINRSGSIKSPSLNCLSRRIWHWCIQKKLHISAESIPGVHNSVARALSMQNADRLEWSLDVLVFRRVITQTFLLT